MDDFNVRDRITYTPDGGSISLGVVHDVYCDCGDHYVDITLDDGTRRVVSNFNEFKELELHESEFLYVIVLRGKGTGCYVEVDGIVHETLLSAMEEVEEYKSYVDIHDSVEHRIMRYRKKKKMELVE